MTKTDRISLTEDEITVEIHSYKRQIKSMQFEISVLKKELRRRLAVRGQIRHRTAALLSEVKSAKDPRP